MKTCNCSEWIGAKVSATERERGLVVCIDYCPFCGKKLTQMKRVDYVMWTRGNSDGSHMNEPRPIKLSQFKKLLEEY